MSKLNKTTKIIEWILLVSLALSIVYVIIRLIIAPSGMPEDVGTHVKSDYVLMLVQCILGLIIMFLPKIIYKTSSIKIPNSILIVYFIFLYCSIFLGEVRSFYYKVPHWDTILHAFSGAMLGALGFSLICTLNKIESVKISLTPFFICLFAFCFALALGALWEVYEYIFDGALSLNMQKHMNADGTAMVGREAMADTMKDLVVDALGALGMVVFGFIGLKRNPDWLDKFELKKDMGRVKAVEQVAGENISEG